MPCARPSAIELNTCASSLPVNPVNVAQAWADAAAGTTAVAARAVEAHEQLASLSHGRPILGVWIRRRARRSTGRTPPGTWPTAVNIGGRRGAWRPPLRRPPTARERPEQHTDGDSEEGPWIETSSQRHSVGPSGSGASPRAAPRDDRVQRVSERRVVPADAHGNVECKRQRRVHRSWAAIGVDVQRSRLARPK